MKQLIWHIKNLLIKISLGNTNIAILLKRNEDCKKYYQQLQTAGIKCYYPNSNEENPEYDVIVSTIHYAKSLKFDTVFIPQATRKNYWRTDKGEDLPSSAVKPRPLGRRYKA